LRSLSYCKLPLVAAFLLLAQAAAAQFARDDAASRKIREAIDSHYLATNFDKAADVLSGTIAACADQCSPQVLARAWMYLGLVRGSGKNDLVGAKEAFKKALELDPAVELDGTLATDATQQAFVEAGGAATKPPPAATAAAEPAPAEPEKPAKPAPEPPPPAPEKEQPAAEDCPPNFPGCGDGGKQTAPVDAYAKNWIGLHIAQDFTFVGGSDVCTQNSQANDDFACYYAGSRSGAYIDEPYPGVESNTTLVFATTRLLLSFDRALTENLLLGARIGYAFGGGPPSGRDVVYEGRRIASVVSEGLAFFPFHLEVRASYWFGSTPLAKPGLRPYVHLGGGLAQVDAKIGVTVKDCGLVEVPTDPEYARLYAACADGSLDPNDQHLREAKLDAWKKLGQGFVTIGGGAVYAFTSDLGLQLNLNLMYTLPGSGVVLEPSLGAVMGF